MLINPCLGMEHRAGAEWKWLGKPGVGVLECSDAKGSDTLSKQWTMGGGEAEVKPQSTELSAPSVHPIHPRHTENLVLLNMYLSLFVPKQSSFGWNIISKPFFSLFCKPTSRSYIHRDLFPWRNLDWIKAS